MLYPVAHIFIQSSRDLPPLSPFPKEVRSVPAVVGYVTGAEASYMGHTIQSSLSAESSYEFNRDA